MNKNLLVTVQSLVIIVLFALLIAPYLVTRASSANNAGSMEGMSAGMMQKLYPLDNTNAAIPTVAFILAKDSLDGWNLHVITTNFTFTPQNIGQAPVADEGHVHLYIDGKLTVVMSEWFHIDSSAMAAGKHAVTVSLNANDHSAFANEGTPIESTQTIYVY
jgi:hypothetical protein